MVEKKEIFRKIDGIINELNDQYQYLSKNQDSFNELELELFAANANFLSEHIKIILKLNNTKGSEPVTKTKAGQEEAALPEITVEHTEEHETVEIKELPVSDEVSDEDIDTTIEEKPVEKKQVFDGKKPVSTDEAVRNEVVIRERTISMDIPAQDKLAKPGEHVPTVNDVISAQRNQSTLGSNYSRQTVTDLKSIINLNDKLLFVKDLFKGYNLAYSEAIELLNRFGNFEAADNFLKNNYAAKNNWAEKQSTVDKFYEILNRRFSK